jgi:hypothetical protein
MVTDTEISTLDQMVKDLDDDKIDEEISKPHAKIRKAHTQKEEVADYNAFQKELTEYVKHHWKEWYKGSIGDNEAFGHAHEILDAAFRQQGGKGFEDAFTLAKKGRLSDVLDIVANALESEAKQKYVSSVLHSVDPTDYEAQTEVVEKLKDKQRHMFPEDMKEQDSKHIAKDYRRFVQSYAARVAQLKKEYGKT